MKVLTQSEISEILDIGSDFLFLDTCQILEPGVNSLASYIFDERHNYLNSHFTSEVIIPGVLILESMLQTMALTIYSNESWKGLALVTNLSAEFLETLEVNSKVENRSKVILNSGGRVEGEVICFSNQRVISRITCSYYSDYVLRALNKKDFREVL